MVNTNKLSDYVKQTRIAKGLKQKDVAEFIGCTPTVINRMECGGTQRPSLKVLSKLSIILELDYFKLLELSGYTKKELDLETEKLYHKVSGFNNFPYLLFLLNTLSNNNLELHNQLLAKTINFSDEENELIIKLYNAIPKLSSKEKEILKMILT